MTIQQSVNCERMAAGGLPDRLSDQDLRVLRTLWAAEVKRLKAIDAQTEAVGPRETGVTDSVYEVLTAYRAQQALLVEELGYRLAAYLDGPKGGRTLAVLLNLMDDELLKRGLFENVV